MMNIEAGLEPTRRRAAPAPAPDTLVHNIAIAVLMLVILIAIAAAHIIVSMHEVKEPDAYPGAALVYASELAFPASHRIDFAPPRFAEWGDDDGARGHIDASLVVGHRCHCCVDVPKLACWVVPCALHALALELDGDAAMAGAPANATSRRVQCYAVVAHRASHAAPPSWYSAAAAALARERHG